MHGELESFMSLWERETERTEALLSALPVDQYDFQPDPAGRSLGELAWHLAEAEAYASTGIERGAFKFDVRPPRIDRPTTIGALLPAFKLVHADAVARVARLEPDGLDAEIIYADGKPWTIRRLLWDRLLLHVIHHRGQLVLLCRLAGGVPPAIYGKTREQTLASKVAPAAARGAT